MFGIVECCRLQQCVRVAMKKSLLGLHSQAIVSSPKASDGGIIARILSTISNEGWDANLEH